jgi:hypothetical protein
MTDLHATPSGFVFGAMEVSAVTELPGGTTVVEIKTEAGKAITVYCSPTGRSLRVFQSGKRHGELRSP